MLVQGSPLMPSDVQSGYVVSRAPQIGLAQSTVVVHSVKGYLAWCQDQLPEMDIPYMISENENTRMSDDDRWHTVASIWKQCTQEFRRQTDDDAAKNEPHGGEPGQGGFGSHPRLTPYETEKVLEALLVDTTEWNLDENDDYDE